MEKRKRPFDFSHTETDKLIDKMEKKVSKEYAKAVKQTTKKLDDYLKGFAAEDASKLAELKAGKITVEQYRKWRTSQIMTEKRWTDMRDSLARDYVNADKIAKSVVNGYMPEVYALNCNYAMYQIEKEIGMRTSFTLYSREAAEKIIRENPKILPAMGKRMKQKIAEGKAVKWQAGRIQSVTLQAILQGESIPNMAKRICTELGEKNRAASVRYARTAATSAENAGRMDAYHRAQDEGIELQKTWIATLDDRTRHWHRELDGQTVGIDEPFNNEYGDIMYPGDPDAEDGANIWNCRCAMITQIAGFERDVEDLDLRYDANLNGMSYEEWKASL